MHMISMSCLQAIDPPPEKKIKVEDSGADASTSLVPDKVGVANAVEDDDVIPDIKSYHLDLDDIPMELLPTHQEKIMKQVLAVVKDTRDDPSNRQYCWLALYNLTTLNESSFSHTPINHTLFSVNECIDVNIHVHVHGNKLRQGKWRHLRQTANFKEKN